MKHFIITFFCFVSSICIVSAQEAIIYYEGLSLYPIDYYSYEFQSLIEPRTQSNPICVIRDTTLVSFLKRKIKSVERCVLEGECMDATIKPTAMIQVILVEDRYCYYTLNLSSWKEVKMLTIDGKSYIPDEELQEVIIEIVKFCDMNKQQIPIEKLHNILNGERDHSNPYWPLDIPQGETPVN